MLLSAPTHADSSSVLRAPRRSAATVAKVCARSQGVARSPCALWPHTRRELKQALVCTYFNRVQLALVWICNIPCSTQKGVQYLCRCRAYFTASIHFIRLDDEEVQLLAPASCRENISTPSVKTAAGQERTSARCIPVRVRSKLKRQAYHIIPCSEFRTFFRIFLTAPPRAQNTILNAAILSCFNIFLYLANQGK